MAGAIVSIVIGMQYGDEGKGMGVHRLYSSDIISDEVSIPRPSLTVRFNGSSQAAHNVISEDGTYYHQFRQFGSGYLADPNQVTYFHRTMLVDPWMLLEEAAELDALFPGRDNGALSSVVVHKDAPILLPIYALENKVHEIARGNEAHGSCGMGVGALAEDVALDNVFLTHRMVEVFSFEALVTRLRIIHQHIKNQIDPIIANFDPHQIATIGDDIDYFFDESFYEDYAKWLNTEYYSAISTVTDMFIYYVLNDESRHVVFEGAQGILLDEWRGFHPYTTWSSTNLRNIHQLFEEVGYAGKYHTYGMVRAYGTRHGYGPFPSERDDLKIVDECNDWGLWQGKFRTGDLDLPLLRYAFTVAKDPGSEYRAIDSVHISCLDQVENSDVPVRIVNSYYDMNNNTVYFSCPINPDLYDLDFQGKLTTQVDNWIYGSVHNYFVNFKEEFCNMICWPAYTHPTISFISSSALQQPNQIIEAVYKE